MAAGCFVASRFSQIKTSRGISWYPSWATIPGAPVNDEAKKRNGNLPGQGGVFNTINSHLYHYAGNNPVKYTDPDGKAAGDEFDTIDDAAKDFAMTYNDDSIRYDREYGTVIRKNENGKYVYDLPVVGARYGKVNIDRNYGGLDIVADIHTHGKYVSPDGDWFSREFDIPSANLHRNRVSYLVNPSGELNFYRPHSDGGYRGTSGNISRVMPRDPNSAGGLERLAPDASLMHTDDPVKGWDRSYVPSMNEIVPPMIYRR